MPLRLFAVLSNGIVVDLVWSGVEWCGMEWCGMEWCGMVWCGMVWNGVEWCEMVCQRRNPHAMVAVNIEVSGL
jgi:hypothetical protein